MHGRLVDEYLWADDYKKLDIDMEISYDKFLYTHLTKLGDKNIEDGGYYRDYSSSAGERYIYSYISEVSSTKTIATKAGELSSVSGLGIGPLFASVFEEGTNYIGLTVGYVYPGSPAESAGLRRGDTIYQVGSTRITKSNYQSLMNELFYTSSGTYTLLYARYVANESAQRYDLVLDKVANVKAATYGYNPILFAAILSNKDVEGDDNAPFCIGYMASESFDSSAQEVLEYQIDDISVVEPDEVSRLNVISGKDCVTLVTCTPYGVNSHRLLVRGVRVDDSDLSANRDNVTNELLNIDMKYLLTFSLIGFCMILAAVAKLRSIHKKRKAKSKEGGENKNEEDR